jgi:hypothetical protein
MRGDLNPTSLLWNETTDKWTFSNDGLNYSNIASSSSEVYANAAFAAQNTTSTYANSAFDVANTALTAGGTIAGGYANSAFQTANSAALYANAAYVAANTSDQKAVSAGVYANSAYSTSNTKLDSTGGTISGDLSITGNLTVLGNAFAITVSSLIVDDPLLHLAANNETTDAVDIGFIGHYSQDAGSTQRHTGLFRDATDGLYYLFDNYLDDSFDTLTPNNTIDIANSSFRIANLTANIITETLFVRGFDPLETANLSYNHANASYNVVNSTSSYANSAFVAANTADQKAVTSGVYANSAYNAANTAISDSLAFAIALG